MTNTQVKSRKKRTRKNSKKSSGGASQVKIATPKDEIVEEVDEVVVDDTKTVEVVVDDTKTKVKRSNKKTIDMVLSDFDLLVETVLDKIKLMRENKKEKVGIRFLTQVNKKIKMLKQNTKKVAHKKPRKNRKTNSNSGFLKPVEVSNQMCKFAKWDSDKLYSRVDVTKCVCAYIKEHDLQNSEDRRQIIPDKKLSKLLGYDSKNDEPLRYYSLQSYLKKHFPKNK